MPFATLMTRAPGFVGACFLILFISSTFLVVGSWHDQHRLVANLLSLLGSIFVLLEKGPVFVFLKKRSGFVLLCFLVVSAFISDYPLWAFLEISCFLGFYSISIAVQVSCEKKDIQEVSRWFCFSVLMMCLFWFIPRLSLFFGLVRDGGGAAVDILSDGFSNPRFLGQFQVAVMALVAAGVVIFRGWVRVGAVFLLFCLSWLLFFLESRGAIAACLAMIVVAGGLGFYGEKREVFVCLCFVMFFGVAFGFLLDFFIGRVAGDAFHVAMQGASLRHPAGKMSLAGREFIWHEAWIAFKNNPVFGLGPMHFASLNSRWGAHPHNSVLQILSEWGGAAAIAFGFLLLSKARELSRQVCWSKLTSAEAAPFLSVFGLLILSLVDGVLVMPFTLTWLAILVGWCIAIANSHSHVLREASTDERPFNRVHGLILCLISVFQISFSTVMYEGVYRERAASDLGVHWPRYWSDGHIP